MDDGVIICGPGVTDADRAIVETFRETFRRYLRGEGTPESRAAYEAGDRATLDYGEGPHD